MYDSRVATLDRPTDAITGEPLPTPNPAAHGAAGSPDAAGAVGVAGSLPELPLDDLVDDLRTWAAHIAAAEAHWLDLVAEFCRRDGHRSWGLATPAHWLAWQCSLSPGTAREHVRVALALQDLPVTRAHFAAGRISYSKVRAITRIADPDNEATLVRLALNATAAQLERTVAAWIGAINRDDPDREAVRYQRRGVTRRYNDHGNAVITIETAPENSDRIIDSIDEWLDDIDPGPFDDGGTDTAAQPDKATLTQRRADAFMALIDDRTGTRHGADRIRANIDIDLRALTHNADGTCQVRNGPSLSAETARRLTCDAELELFHTPTPTPPAGAGPSTGIGTGTGTGTTEPGSATTVTATGAPRCTCTTHDHHSASDLSLTGLSEPVPLMETDHITNAVAAALAATIPEPVPVPEQGRVTRTINRATRRAIARRDKGCCQFPGCTNNRHTQIHHIIHWACGGDHTLTNLTTLCSTHHRLVHEGGYRIAGNGHAPVFLRPDDSPMTTTPTQGDPAIIDRHAMALDLGPHTLSRGTGDRLQLHYTVAVLAERHPDTKIQPTKMTTTSATDLIQHNQTRPDSDHATTNSAPGSRNPADGNSHRDSANESHQSTSSAADTTPSPASASVPAGTPRTRPTDCTRRTETGPPGASEPAA